MYCEVTKILSQCEDRQTTRWEKILIGSRSNRISNFNFPAMPFSNIFFSSSTLFQQSAFSNFPLSLALANCQSGRHVITSDRNLPSTWGWSTYSKPPHPPLRGLFVHTKWLQSVCCLSVYETRFHLKNISGIILTSAFRKGKCFHSC